MRVHHSSQLERLVDALGDVVAEPLRSPLAAETVVVPSRAMGAWLALRLAERIGIWANPRFVTLDVLARDLAHEDGADEHAWDEGSLPWSIASALATLLGRKELAPVAAYLEGDRDGTKRLALARRLASTFERYLVHRPAMVLSWERGEPGEAAILGEHAWQPVLWRAVITRLGGDHRARWLQRLLARLNAGEVSAKRLPERVSVFAPAGLPRVHGELLAALARTVPVNVFARSSVGHPLHDALGTREALTLAALTVSSTAGIDLDAPVPPSSLPAHVAVHACHGPMRECEVLRDQLLAALNDDPTLEPRDVLVLCPDLATYAPVIDAVFGVPESERTFLPYRVVDRASTKQLRVVDAFLALLDLVPSRLAAPEVVDFLAREPVRARFDLEENELDLVRRWVSESGIRWGEDEAHREEERQPRLRANTWRFGLDRLAVGYAVGKDGTHDRTLVAGTLPYDDVEGHATSTLGGLLAFCEALFGVRQVVRGTRPIAAWVPLLRSALEGMLKSTWQTEPQHRMVREALDAMAASAARGGFEEEVPLAVVRDALAGALEERGRAEDAAVAGVTFASFASPRVVPARVVALLGMNDGVVPRAARAADFDLLAAWPEAGDPSVRDDDRQAFLDAVLAAREKLVVTYVGQSIATNAALPPSVLVSELLDLLPEAERRTAVVRHPLHAFSPAYFTGEDARLFSHAAPLCAGAEAMRGERVGLEPFVRAPLPPSDLPRTLTLDQLVKFFEHPARAFMMTRLRVVLGRDAEVLADREPMDLDALAAWKVGAGLLERGAAGDADDGDADVPDDLVAEGVLPLGVVGAAAYAEVAEKVAWIRARVAEKVGSARLRAPIPFEIGVPAHDTRVLGFVKQTTPAVHLLSTYSNVSGKQRIAAWVRHVAANAAGHALATVLVCKNDVFELAAIPRREAEALLRDLVGLYWRGLEAPLLFFPETSIAYAERLAKSGDAGEAHAAAEKAFGKDNGDGTCPYIARVFGGISALVDHFEPFAEPRDRARWPSFADLATTIAGPMLARRVSTKGES